MASTLTGTVATMTVSGLTVTGASGELGEATVTIGKERAKFNPVGTNVSMHATGMKTAEGTINKRWTSGAAGTKSRIFQDLIDTDNEFDTTINVTGGGQLTVSGCLAVNRSVRSAPGTDTLMEVMTFTGLDWGQTV